MKLNERLRQAEEKAGKKPGTTSSQAFNNGDSAPNGDPY